MKKFLNNSSESVSSVKLDFFYKLMMSNMFVAMFVLQNYMLTFAN